MGEMREYTTVRREASDEFEERKSVFIGHARHIDTEDEALEFIKKKKKEYYDATHNVYAYILSGGNVARYSDDVIVLSGAHILRQGTREEVFAHVEELAETGLDVPQITHLMQLLRERGIDAPKNVYTVAEATTALKKLFLTGGDA